MGDEVLSKEEREIALLEMQRVSSAFYRQAIQIGVHPFIEFCGLMNEYIQCCREAHDQGIDFSQCNTHSGKHLPMAGHNVKYVNEKLECIFTGRSVVEDKRGSHDLRENAE